MKFYYAVDLVKNPAGNYDRVMLLDLYPSRYKLIERITKGFDRPFREIDDEFALWPLPQRFVDAGMEDITNLVIGRPPLRVIGVITGGTIRYVGIDVVDV